MPRKDGEMAPSIKFSPSWKYMLIISVLKNGSGESLGRVCSKIRLAYWASSTSMRASISTKQGGWYPGNDR